MSPRRESQRTLSTPYTHTARLHGACSLGWARSPLPILTRRACLGLPGFPFQASAGLEVSLRREPAVMPLRGLRAQAHVTHSTAVKCACLFLSMEREPASAAALSICAAAVVPFIRSQHTAVCLQGARGPTGGGDGLKSAARLAGTRTGPPHPRPLARLGGRVFLLRTLPPTPARARTRHTRARAHTRTYTHTPACAQTCAPVRYVTTCTRECVRSSRHCACACSSERA
jgi:hypothetical protein